MRIGAINDELSSNIKRALELAVALGIQEIELHTFNDKPVEMLDATEVKSVKHWLNDLSLQVCCLSSTIFLRCHLDDRQYQIEWCNPFICMPGNYAEHLHALKHALEIAEELQAPFVRIFGFWKDEPLNSKIYEQVIERLQEPIELAESVGIPLILENCPHTYFDWGVRAIRLIEMADSPWLKMLWDPCTGMRNREPDIMTAYSRIRPWLAHVHAKDIRFTPSGKRDHVYVPIGEGEMNWPAILGRLIADDYPGVISLETHHQASDGTKESAAKAMMAGMQGAIASVCT